VAAGRLDFFWEFGLKPWDMAAGALLVQEAGGRVAEMTGAPLSVAKSDHVLADNAILHDEILAAFADIFRGTLRVPLPVI
jgi:myo-inositol-1(or 4)-monophosphatase